MQYKTVTVEHKAKYKKNEAFTAGDEYQEIINQHALQGWNLLGIHPTTIRRRMGCLKAIWYSPLIAFLGAPKQVDVLIFFREGDPSEYIHSENAAKKRKASEAVKKTGAAIADVTKSAVSYMKSEETASKLSSLKEKAMSSLAGLAGASGNGHDDDFDDPQE